MAEEKEVYEHSLYKHCEEKDADAIAWAFVNSKKMVRFPFKFPELGPNEIRANVLYAGLCHSDVLTVRPSGVQLHILLLQDMKWFAKYLWLVQKSKILKRVT